MIATQRMDFSKFKIAVANQFKILQEYELFFVDVGGDDLWKLYLESFPPGSNPMFRARTEYDCSGCRNFIRRVGNVVAVIGGKRATVWDVIVPEFQVVADAMAAKVRGAEIRDVFLTFEGSAGVDKSFENLVNDVKVWEHFFAHIPAKYVAKKDLIGTKLSEVRSTHDVFERSLKELKLEAVETVQELIAQNSLYRGEENKFAVDSFATLKRAYDGSTDFAWTRLSRTPPSVSRIRNTAIGTLMVNLSADVEIEDAVKAFEAMVAPANYKRPTALVSKAQVERAKQTIQDLGLTSALQRRFAVLKDVTVNNILFVDRDARVVSKDIFDDLSTKARTFDKVEEITIQKFLADVMPKVSSIEVLLENKHAPNLVSLIAADDPTAGKLFKWDNQFSWSYNGEMADAIKERVKAAGGQVTGDLCCRLAWEYTDDLDFHCSEPDGYHIQFTNKRIPSPSGGILDLDANGSDGQRPDPAENIYYQNRSKMKKGVYILMVHNYNRRSDGRGFVVEIEFDGQSHRIEHPGALRHGELLEVAKVKYDGKEFKIIESLPSTSVSRDIWGLKTQDFHRANVVMMSPNHWDGHGVGNRHYMFFIDGCRNDGTARGFFNEFLREGLNEHRKVLEMVGGKMKVSGVDQLSGLGFSSTSKNTLVCRVKGSFTRDLKIVF